MKKQNVGFSLLEIMLVLAIGGVILSASIQQYLSYRVHADAMQVKANVEAIFQAMAFYNRAECYGSTDNSGNVNPGALNPANPSLSTLPSTLLINITTQLRNAGYLSETIPVSPLITTSGIGTQGYVAQFNLTLPLPDRDMCISTNTNTNTFVNNPPNTYYTYKYIPPNSPSCTGTMSVGKIVIWRSQVAVNFGTTAKARQYVNLLAGDCLSSVSGGTVAPCDVSGNTGQYIVWERIASNVNSGAVSSYWQTIPVVSQFTQGYRVWPAGAVTPQYFLCGN